MAFLRMSTVFVFLLVLSLTVVSADEVLTMAQKVFKPIPQSLPELKGKPVTPEKVHLGKMLFFEPRLSASALISCNTCHNLGLGGADYQEASVGHGWHRGKRNAPTVLNSVFNKAQFWDGRAKDLMEQAKGPVQASVEMNNSPDMVIKTLKSMPHYEKMFKKVFPDETDPVTFDNMARAIEAFEATLLTPDSPFDKYLKGDTNALNAKEKEGLKLFMNKGCSSCHGGINMGGENYFPFGVVEKPSVHVRPEDDKGRFGVTKTRSDEYVFKSPSLRNIELTLPYFHSGSVWSLKEAISIMGSAQLGIKLSGSEIDSIVTFLKSTTGKQPEVKYPILPPPSHTTPKPKLD